MLNRLPYLLAALTVTIAIIALLVKASRNTDWCILANLAFFLALAALSTAIATHNLGVTIGALSYCLLTRFPAVRDGK